MTSEDRVRGRRSGRGRSFAPMFILAFAAVALTACSMGGGGEPRADPFSGANGGDSDGPVFIEVRNDNLYEARIYAVWDGTEFRLGTVRGKSTQTLETRWRAGDLHVRVDVIAGGELTSQRLNAWPGETLLVIVPHDL